MLSELEKVVLQLFDRYDRSSSNHVLDISLSQWLKQQPAVPTLMELVPDY
jgi:hypothetical protein